MNFLQKKINFIFSSEFIFSILNILKVNVNNQVLFLIYSKSDLQYMKDVTDALENGTIPFKVIFFEKDKDLVSSNSTYVYVHPYLSLLLRAKLVITTSVQLKRKSFPFVKRLSHVPHSIVSLHMIYNEKAFNDFDYIFCSGTHHIKEIQEINKLYGCSIKGLKSGYTKLDLLHEIAKTEPIVKNDRKIILLAPSWGKENILESIGKSLIDAIVSKGYILIIRPHPMFFIEKQNIIENIKEKCDNINVFLENTTDCNDSFFKADIMISDYSGVAFEFAFLRERPILFIDVAKKVLNENYRNINLDPIEISLRNKLGIITKPRINEIENSLELIINDKKSYQKSIVAARNELLFNYPNASYVIAKQIKNIVKEL